MYAGWRAETLIMRYGLNAYSQGCAVPTVSSGSPVPTYSATIMYMSATVGIAELRQNLSRYLKSVKRGERFVVTDHNKPVAEFGPPSATGAALDRLIAEGRVMRPVRRGLPEPLELAGDPHALSSALDDIRGER